MKRAAWFALLGGTALALPGTRVLAAAPAVSARFVAPARPMVLTRTLVRALADSRRIVTRRTWQLAFRQTATGYVVDGVLVDSQVDAPPQLAALARIERERPDGGLFPLTLDSAGLIAAATSPDTAASVAAARGAAAQSIAGSALAASDRGQAHDVLGALAAAAQQGAFTWPRDLFLLGSRHREDRRDIAAGTGQAGSVTVIVDVREPVDGALPRQISRRVVTRIGSHEQSSEEQWSLAPAGQFTAR